MGQRADGGEGVRWPCMEGDVGLEAGCVGRGGEDESEEGEDG